MATNRRRHRHGRRLRTWVKVALVAIALLAFHGCVKVVKEDIARIDAERAARVQEYKACIVEQSETRGWIVRSECSSDWRMLDMEAGLEYEVRGKDVYLAD